MKAVKDNAIVFSPREMATIDDGSKRLFVHTAGKNPNYEKCPFGSVGDYLWVQEKHQYTHAWPEQENAQPLEAMKFTTVINNGPKIALNAAARAALGDRDPFVDYEGYSWYGRNEAARRLPAWASRLTIEITLIQYMPLNVLPCFAMRLDGIGDSEDTDEQIVRKYVSYWDGCHSKGFTWVSNPTVWVVGFSAIWKNILSL